jgi:predicted nucleotidyltransferase
MVTQETIHGAARKLLAAAPGARVILFGSHARGEAQSDSDLDFLVVEPEVKNRLAEMTRLRQTLRGLPVPVDVVVMSAEQFEYWRDTPSTLAYRASKEGRVYEQAD